MRCPAVSAFFMISSLLAVASQVCLAVLAPEIADARVKGFFSKYNKARAPACVPSCLLCWSARALHSVRKGQSLLHLLRRFESAYLSAQVLNAKECTCNCCIRERRPGSYRDVRVFLTVEPSTHARRPSEISDPSKSAFKRLGRFSCRFAPRAGILHPHRCLQFWRDVTLQLAAARALGPSQVLPNAAERSQLCRLPMLEHLHSDERPHLPSWLASTA